MNNVLALQKLTADRGGQAEAVGDGSMDGGQMEAASHVSLTACDPDGGGHSHASLLLCN